MTTHSSILGWRSPWTEEPGELQSMGLQKSRTQLSTHATMYGTGIKTDIYQWNRRIKSSEIIACNILLFSHVHLCATPWTATQQDSTSFNISWSLLKFTFIMLMMPSNQLLFCHPLILLPSIFSSIRVFSNDWLFASGG